MLDEIAESMRKQLGERIASPLMGSFAISWCLWNWKFLVILFSDASVTQTFSLITLHAFPDARAWTTFGFAFPLATALLYIFGYPIPARYVYAYSLRRQKEVVETKRDIDGQAVLTLDESRKIRDRSERLTVWHYEEVDKRNKEIDSLREEVAALKSIQQKVPAEPQADKGEIALPEMSSADVALLLAKRLDSESLIEYTKWKYPSLPVSQYWNDKAIRDLNKNSYPTLSEIDSAVERAKAAVNAYSMEKPEWFKSSTDFITKSLGFVDPEFRRQHDFAEETRRAFLRHSSLLK